MDLTTIDDLKAALRLAGVRSNKALGQHFLVDREVVAAMVAAGELTSSDTVLEVGPGLGVMTGELTTAAGRVVAVELDPVLAGLLRRDAPPNVEVVQADIRRFDLRRLPVGYKVVANIPYYLTAPLLRRLVTSPNQPRLAALLVQQEVAQRITASPGQMSVLAVSVQYYARPALLQVVTADKFWPPPKVDSAIVQLRMRDRPAFAADAAVLFRLVKAGFGERRKMLKNSLAGGLRIEAAQAVELVAAAGLSPTARAQELSLEDWERLYSASTEAHRL